MVERYDLPIEALRGLASGAGLEWVNSDADKIRAVQEAMANEPKPVHVPRERKPVVLAAAMRPATALLADGPQNLLDAVCLARLDGAFDALASLPRATTPAAVAGYPHLTVPMGFVRGLPLDDAARATLHQRFRGCLCIDCLREWGRAAQAGAPRSAGIPR